MNSPLKYDAEIVKEFEIDKSIEVDDEAKLGHVRAQLDQIKQFLWRERVELLLAETQASNKNELVADKGKSQVTEKRNNIRQVVSSIKTLTQLQDELEKSLTN